MSRDFPQNTTINPITPDYGHVFSIHLLPWMTQRREGAQRFANFVNRYTFKLFWERLYKFMMMLFLQKGSRAQRMGYALRRLGLSDLDPTT